MSDDPTKPYTGGIHVVEVTTDDLAPATELWAAAVPRGEAVTAVLAAVPEGWTAELTSRQLAPEHIERLKLRPGTVRQLSN
jgi:hypothetical protein